MVPTSTTVTATSRARIVKLESEVASLQTTVRNIQARLGCVPTEASNAHLASSQAKNPHSSADEDDCESNVSESSLINPPGHLLQLFDNGLLDSRESRAHSVVPHAPNLHNVQGSYELRRLMPSRRDMVIITAQASSWLSLHNAIFPMANLTKTSDEMLSQYDKLQDPNADPIAIAALLLCIAITVLQSPDHTSGRTAESFRDAPSFIKDISDTVERIVISDDALSASFEGVEITLLFLRL